MAAVDIAILTGVSTVHSAEVVDKRIQDVKTLCEVVEEDIDQKAVGHSTSGCLVYRSLQLP